MINSIIHILLGESVWLDLATSARSYKIDHNGPATDIIRLRNDFAMVGRDLKRQLRRESTNHRAC